jgi:hypothetical protein
MQNRSWMLWLALVVLAACHADRRTRQSTLPPVALNENFDDINLDGFFRRWNADVPASTRSTFGRSAGRHGAALHLKTGQSPERAVRLSRVIDASVLRGQRLRFSVWTKAAASAAGSGELRLAILRPTLAPSVWDSARSPIAYNEEWSPTAVVIDVPKDAISLELTLIANGSIDLTIDDLSVESHPASGSISGPLTDTQQANLQSLVRMIGYLRFVYPGDVAARADWQSIEIDAIGRILPLNDMESVKNELTRLLERIAPDAVLYTGQSPPRLKIEQPHEGTRLTRWVHDGFGNSSPYASFRTGIDEPNTTGMHIMMRKRLTDLGPCKRAAVQTAMANREGQPIVQLELVPLVGRNRTAITAPADSLQSSVSTDLSDDAYGVAFGVFVHGFGVVDIATITLRCDGRVVAEIRADSAFDTSGVARFLYTLSRAGECASGKCLRIERRPETTLQSSDVVDVEIGNGLRLRMPVVAWTDGTRTLPLRQRFDPEIRIPMSDRQARLAAVLDLWVVLRWFCPYLEDQHIDLDSTLGPALQEAATADTSDTQRHALSRLTLALHDDHARVLRPGIDDGLLPVLFRSLEDRIIVTATLPPGNGIPLGSTLVSIDGIPAPEARLRSADLMSAATPAFALRHSTYGIAFGKKGTVATVVVREPGNGREVVHMVPRLDRAELVAKLREGRPASGSVLTDRIVYVDLHTLDEATWTSLLPKLSDAKAIIFDLRGYVGTAAFLPLEYLADHELRSPTFVHSLLISSDTRRYEDHIWYIAPRRQRLRARAIFLADARTASAPETILQIVKGEHLGSVVGEPTGGTNGSTAEYDLIGEMSMRFTAMRVLNHDGSVFQGQGITPDVTVHPTVNGIIALRDEVLEAAIDLAKQ